MALLLLQNKIDLESRAILEPYLNSFRHDTSGLTFTSLFMWRNLNHFRYEIINDMLCISGINYLDPDQEMFVFPPLPKERYAPQQLSDTIDILKKRFQEAGRPFKIKLMPLNMIPFFEEAKPGQFVFTPDRDNFDYVYRREDLASLKGRKYHRKKNHWNYFMRTFSFEYLSLTEDLVKECLELNSRLLQKKHYTPLEEKLIALEEEAIYECLTNMKKVGYRGGVIRINNQVEAFTIAGKLHDDTVVVHVEKANAKIRGLYQAINQQFCENDCQDVIYINREEDMGLENLRKAKRSYRPVKMIEKCDAVLI